MAEVVSQPSMTQASGRRGRFMIKSRVVENDKPKHISNIKFGLFSGADIMKLSELEVCSRELYQMPSREPANYGCLDSRLGVSNKKDICKTCGQALAECNGHFGHIRLALPVFHIGYFKQTLMILQSICKTCSRVLLGPAERVQFLRRMRDPKLDALRLVKILKKIVDQCKKVHTCPWCGSFNNTVKKVMGAPTLKLIHDKYKHKSADEDRIRFVESFGHAIEMNSEIGTFIDKAGEDLSPLKVLELFRAIPDEDTDLLWTDADGGRPENLILTHMSVPPVCIRPSVAMDGGGGSNEDDLTVKLQEIVHINSALELALQNGGSMKMIAEDWDFLQVQTAAFFNGELPGLPPAMRPKKPIRGLCQRLKGKKGRFRGNLSGKRVDFSGRTVISPDPNLPLHCVGVPVHVAKVLTFPERVTETNLQRLQRAVRNGPKYPGANIVRSGGMSRSLAYGDRDKASKFLRIGDVVDRHLIDGDCVLFNRQPSLHKMSIMCHRAKVMPWRTFRFNECVCAPYNADFDGDEMNLHLPQTEEARAEAALLMDVRKNLCTPRSGEPLISACQDFLTASFMLTQRQIFMTRDEFCQVVSTLSDAGEFVKMPPPAIFMPVPLWTGKQVINLLLRPNDDSTIKVNAELKAKNYSGKGKYMCARGGYVCVRHGQLMCGNLDKSSLGGSKTGLIYVIIRDQTPEAAAKCLHRLTKMCTRWLTNYGFSISIEDVMPSSEVSGVKNDMVQEGYDKCISDIALYKQGKLPLQPGCNEEQSLESTLNGILGKLRDTIGNMCVNELPFHNSPRIMAACGSKGSTLNLCQMIACVGQQNVNGARIADGFVHRTLPIFKVHAKEPAAKGFVANSFFTGLNATEFFFHTMGGREGLVDTAVKTAETGYMQRRMMKALEDLSVQYDSTVRTSNMDVVQFTYGDDGLEPGLMEANDRPVDLVRTRINIQAEMPCVDEVLLTADELRTYTKAALDAPRFTCLLPQGRKFLDEVGEFFYKMADDIDARRGQLIIDGSRVWGSHEMRSVRPQLSDPSAAGPEAGSDLWVAEGEHVMRNTMSLTLTQFNAIINFALARYERSKVEPGEASGAVAAHSMGEPATQMTLKTFHFAGVASMNVTLGVPRIKEIINASKIISTPIIEAALVNNTSEVAARIVKGRIEKTCLGEIAEYIREVYDPAKSFLQVKLDLRAIAALRLDVDVQSVRMALLKAPKLKLKDTHVAVASEDTIIVVAPPASRTSANADTSRGERYFALQTLKAALPQVIVQGIPSVSRAVISHDETARGPDPCYKLLVEGYSLLDVMGTPGVVGTETLSNHIIEVEHTLGIEAARVMIMKELQKTYGSYGIGIDHRHLMLLADVMTYRGEVLGITRFGIAKMKDSVLMLASFEKTPDHLFDAAVHSRQDAVTGVSECIIMGVPIPLGTGLFKLRHKPNKKKELPKREPPLLAHAFKKIQQ